MQGISGCSWRDSESTKQIAITPASRDVLLNQSKEVSNAVKSEAISPLKINVIGAGMYAGTEETPVQLCFHHCHRLAHVNQDELRGGGQKTR